MKKIYGAPDFDVSVYEAEDIITVSVLPEDNTNRDAIIDLT